MLRIVATKFAFIPRCVPVPEGVPVRMRLASPDVVHGIIVNGTNANTMVVPGYVAQVETTFHGTGDRLMPCHEYCGQGHSQMWGVIRVLSLRRIGTSVRASGWHAGCRRRAVHDRPRLGLGTAAALRGPGAGASLGRLRRVCRRGRSGLLADVGAQPTAGAVRAPSNYFISLTAHGSTMAYVVTTFFAMGFGYTIATTARERPLAGRIWAWVGFAVALAGSVMMLVPVFAGIASVLYTFYPPLLASAWFYIGFLLLIAGSWAWATIMIVQMRLWKREHPGQPVPFAMFAIVATAILWLWTDAGVASEVAFQSCPFPSAGRTRSTPASPAHSIR